MSRPIKFRAWHKSRKAFMYFELSELNDSMITKVEDGWYLEDCDLMQFTGLLDKNGKEVFEGDIVRGTTNEFGELRTLIACVEYNEDMVLMPFHKIWDHDDNFWMDCVINGFDVIGNIYEHPNLLPSQD